MLLGVGQDRVGELLGLGRRHRRQVERPQHAVHPDLGRRVRRHMEVGASLLDHGLEQLSQTRRHMSATPSILRLKGFKRTDSTPFRRSTKENKSPGGKGQKDLKDSKDTKDARTGQLLLSLLSLLSFRSLVRHLRTGSGLLLSFAP